MEIIKITAIWCSGCLIMNKVWDKFKNNYSFIYKEYDYDMDEEEIEKYNPGKILPVFIVMDNDKELLRITGELSYEEFKNKMMEVGAVSDKED